MSLRQVSKSIVKDTFIAVHSFFVKFVAFFLRPSRSQVAFIPHGGMYDNRYDLHNYKSDNALSLLVYMIERYGTRFKYVIACDSRQYESIIDDVEKRFPGISVKCVRFFPVNGFKWSTVIPLMKSKIIFSCEGYFLPFKSSWHTVVFLGYFKPFKDDYRVHQLMMKDNFDRQFDICISPSSIYSNVVAHTYNVTFSKFVTLGFSRDDMLLSKYSSPTTLEETIHSSVDYEVKKVFLYTPTYRDYEDYSSGKRGILGFDVNKAKFEAFLRERGILIICKLHSRQNFSLLEGALCGVIMHNPTDEYGLCELLQRSDCLITDYTSTYFDYLLLDRPVLFNFYDFERYKQTRGFTYDPIEPILAGEVFSDEESFYEKAEKIINGKDEFAEKRRFVRDLNHKYVDAESSRRICNYIFGN